MFMDYWLCWLLFLESHVYQLSICMARLEETEAESKKILLKLTWCQGSSRIGNKQLAPEPCCF